MKNRFLITGVCGFVARYFIDYLSTKYEHLEILGLDISDNIGFSCKGLTYKKVNLLDKVEVEAILSEFSPDYIVHLASVSSVAKSWQQPVESFQNNTNICLNLLESVRKLQLGTRVLSVGSSEEYGEYEASRMPLKEGYELKPNNPYSVARVSQGLLSKLYAKSYGVDVVLTRSFNHIGPRQSDMFVIPSFVKQLVQISKSKLHPVLQVGNVDVVRDFLDVRDVVRAYYNILVEAKSGEVYNVCSGNGVKLRDIIDNVSKKLNIEVELNVDESRIRPNETMLIVGDNSKIKEELTWSPDISLDESLHDMIEYWKSVAI